MIDSTPRLLDRDELRVLGCLLEKEQATPEYYPLMLNALVAACNQRSNRYPVLNLSEQEVRGTLVRLHRDKLVLRQESPRSTKWRHNADRHWNLNPASKAALTVLLLRGPQTAGEIRARATRLHEFASAAAAESAVADLAGPPEPIVMLLEREPGQKEPRWEHQLGVEGTADGRRGNRRGRVARASIGASVDTRPTSGAASRGGKHDAAHQVPRATDARSSSRAEPAARYHRPGLTPTNSVDSSTRRIGLPDGSSPASTSQRPVGSTISIRPGARSVSV